MIKIKDCFDILLPDYPDGLVWVGKSVGRDRVHALLSQYVYLLEWIARFNLELNSERI